MNIVNVGYDSTNYYVIGGGTSWLLVDVGWPGTLRKLEAQLRRKDIALRHIRHLLATHYHPDHAGLAQEIKAAGVRLLVIEEQSAAIPILKTWMKPSNNYVDITLNDNTHLTIAESRAFLRRIGIDGEIVLTPGHSDDSVTLVLDDGSAFTGDLTLPSMADGEAAERVRRSWELIQAKGANRIFPGHGPAPRYLPPILATETP